MKLVRRKSLLGSVLGLLGFGALTAGAAVLGSIWTGQGTGRWYRRLRKPSYTPPSWVFPVVWTPLYVMIAASGYRVWKEPASAERRAALGLWGAQLALNAGWSGLFFAAHKKKAALVELGLLIAAVGAYIGVARQVDRPAAWLMVPYLGWGAFAGVLNADIVRLNPKGE